MRAKRLTVLILVAASFGTTLTAGADGPNNSFTIDKVTLTGSHRLLSLRKNVWPFEVAFSPDNRQFVWVPFVGRDVYSNQLMIASVEGTTEHELVHTSEGIREAVWAPNGQSVALSTRDGIWVVEADGTGLRRIAHEGSNLAWAPNSSELAIEMHDATLGRSVLAIITLDGDMRTIGEGGSPRWSPSGKLLAFVGDSGIRIVPAVGGKARALVRGGSPKWSPDGRRIAFSRSGSPSNSLWVVSSRGGRPTLLSKRASSSGTFAWSPRGRWIAYEVSQRRRDELRVVASSGGRSRLLMRTWRSIGPLSWSRDGLSVLYVSRYTGF